MQIDEKIKYITIAILLGIIYIFLSLFSKQYSNVTFSLVLTLACLIYFIGYYIIDLNKIPAKIILLTAFIYSLILFTTPINKSSDTTAYLLGARVAFIGKYNPYTTPYIQFKSDVMYQNFKNYTWAEFPYTYSPLFLYISGIFLYIAGNNFITNIMIFRIFFLITFIAGTFIFKKISKNHQALYLYLLNPIVLNDLVKESHIESLLVLLILAGVYFFLFKKFLRAFLSFISAFLIKINFIIFLPMVLIHMMRSGALSTKKIFIIAIAGASAIVLSYLPFWQGVDIFSRIIGLISGSKFQLISINFVCLVLIPILTLFHKSLYDGYILSGQILFIAGIIIYTFYSIRLFITKTDIYMLIKSLNFSYFIYLFFLINWFFPHYATILLLLSALIYGFKEEPRYLKYIFIITIYSSLYFILPK